jgi:hypothetical protein
LAHVFGDLKIGEAFGVRWSRPWVKWWSKGGLVLREHDVAVVGDDKTEETEGGIRGCDCHGLILNAFLE